jgi:hypothetical protein
MASTDIIAIYAIVVATGVLLWDVYECGPGRMAKGFSESGRGSVDGVGAN